MTAKPTAAGLDWSRHKVGDPRPCRICRRPALMRDANGIPCHKVCAEAANEQPTTPTRPHLQLIEGGRTA